MMYHCIAIAVAFPSDTKDFEDVSHPSLHQPVHCRQEHAEEKYRGDDYRGRRDHIVFARPSYLLHLHPHIMEKFARIRDRSTNALADACGCPGDCVTARFAVLHLYRLAAHKTLFISPSADRLLPPSASGAGWSGAATAPSSDCQLLQAQLHSTPHPPLPYPTPH